MAKKESVELDLVKIKDEINTKLGDKETMDALVITTFKGLTPQLMKRALLEGYMRGLNFQDFLKKNVYAIPFNVKDGNRWVPSYSLITSIDYARKIGQKSGVVGKSAPTFEEKDGKIVSCSVTIQKMVNGHVGDFTATVYFDEYDTGKGQWTSRPRTMIAKVAEMHALRMACPEELSQLYVEEEHQKDAVIQVDEKDVVDLTVHEEAIKSAKTINQLNVAWKAVPPEAKKTLKSLKDEQKILIEDAAKSEK